MQIYGHHIQTSMIIGISALMIEKEQPNGLVRLSYYFEIYTMHYPIRIATKKMDVWTGETEDHKETSAQFKQVYFEARAEVLEQIREVHKPDVV